MTRYFFHVEDAQPFTDAMGTVLPDLAAARRESVRYAGALLADLPDAFWSSRTWAMHVADGHRTLFTLSFRATDPATRTAA